MNPTSKTVTGSIALPTPPSAFAINPDGSFAYAVCDNTVVPINLTTNTTLPIIALQHSGTTIIISKDGRYAYVVSEDAHITRVNLSTNEAAAPLDSLLVTDPNPLSESGRRLSNIAITADDACMYLLFYNIFFKNEVRSINLVTGEVTPYTPVKGVIEFITELITYSQKLERKAAIRESLNTPKGLPTDLADLVHSYDSVPAH